MSIFKGEQNLNTTFAELIFINNILNSNLILNQINSLISNDFNKCFPTISPNNPTPISNEDNSFISKNKGNKSEFFHSSGSSKLFTNVDMNSFLVEKEINFLKKKKSKERRPRKDNWDNIRKKIKRGFFNNALINKLNDKLKNMGIIKYFAKFPHHFLNDVNKNRNKEILNMTLREIFENKELFVSENKEDLSSFSHNLKVVESDEIKENKEFKVILNKSFGELYKEYINSDEFKIIEINRLKKKNDDEYIKKYIYLAKHLIEFFSQ